MLRNFRKQHSETSSLSNLPTTPTAPVELNSLACGRLEGPNGRFVAQCVLVDLGDRSKPLGGQDNLHALVTTHHAVPSLSDLEASKLVLGTKERPLKYSLGYKIVRDSFVSCCGERGIWKARAHPNEPCPYKWNWTLVALKPAFVQELCAKQRLTFLVASRPPSESFKSRLCHVFARRPDGDIFSHPADLKNPIVQPSGPNGLEDEVNLYTQSCPLRYTLSAFQPAEPGSAIVYCANPNTPEMWRLLGIQSSHPPEEQCGISLTHVLDSAIKEGRYCELVPCLSFLQQTLQYQSSQMASLLKLSSCLEIQKVGNEDALKKQRLLRIIEMLGFVLSSTADQAQLNLQPLARNYSGMRFLCDLFSCSEGLSHDSITEVLADIPALVKDPFLRQTGSICKQLFELLNDMAEGSTDDKIVEVAFELWLKMLHFNICENSTGPDLNDSQGFAVVNHVRSWERMKSNAKIQQLFSDISLIHQQKIGRTSIHQKQEFDRKNAEVETIVRDHQLELAAVHTKNAALLEEVQALKQKLVLSESKQMDLERKLEEANDRIYKMEQREVALMPSRPMPSRPSDVPLQEKTVHAETTSAPMTPAATPTMNQEQRLCEIYPARPYRPSICPEERAGFWVKDISKLLAEDITLRNDIANLFAKINGASDGASWEHLIKHLDLKMNPEQLETSPSGDILLSILKVWSRKELVTVRCFCDVCNELGITVVEKKLKLAEQNITTASENSATDASSLANIVEGTGGKHCSPDYNV